jgi:hypothetical protein
MATPVQMKMEQEIKSFQTMQKGELVIPKMMPVVSQFASEEDCIRALFNVLARFHIAAHTSL